MIKLHIKPTPLQTKMIMDIFISLVFIILLVYFFFSAIKDEEKRQIEEKRKIEELNKVLDDFDFETNDRYPLDISDVSGVSIAYDDKNKKVCFIEDYQVNLYSYKKIIQSEIQIDGETEITSTQNGSTIGALADSYFFGGFGSAFIGGTTESKETRKAKSINLKITINDTSSPIYKINFLDRETIKGDQLYNQSYALAEKWHGIITAIIKQTESSHYNKNPMPNSTADELLKLKELLDINALSKQEFESAKYKVLNG